MRTARKFCLLFTFALFFLSCICSAPARAEKFYYAVEVNRVLCGYAEINTSPIKKDGQDMILLGEKVFVMLSALGFQLNTEIRLTYHIDPATGKFFYHENEIQQGAVKLKSAIRIEGNTACCTASILDREKRVELPPDVILESPLSYPHLIKDLVQDKLEKKTYKTFEVRAKSARPLREVPWTTDLCVATPLHISPLICVVVAP